MSIETALLAAVQPLCARVYPDVAPINTARPYIVWQQVGGPALMYLEGALPNKASADIQITVWANTRLEANSLIRQIEAVLVASATMQARPLGALIAAYDDTNELRGALQDFEIWATR